MLVVTLVLEQDFIMILMILAKMVAKDVLRKGTKDQAQIGFSHELLQFSFLDLNLKVIRQTQASSV